MEGIVQLFWGRGGDNMGFPGGTNGKEPTCQKKKPTGDIRDLGSIPGSGRSPGGGPSNPL